MDFFVVGFGIGSLLVIVGFVIRDLGPLLRRSQRETESTESAALWRRRCDGMSAVVMWAGGGLIVLTAMVTAIGVSDSIATIIVVLSAVAALLAALIGVAHYTRLAPAPSVVSPPPPADRKGDAETASGPAVLPKPISRVVPPPPLARRDADPNATTWQAGPAEVDSERSAAAPPPAPQAERVIGDLIERLSDGADDERTAYPTWGSPRPNQWPTTQPPAGEPTTLPPLPKWKRPEPKLEPIPEAPMAPVRTPDEVLRDEREFPGWTPRRRPVDPRRQAELGGSFASPIFTGIGGEQDTPAEAEPDSTEPDDEEKGS